MAVWGGGAVVAMEGVGPSLCEGSGGSGEAPRFGRGVGQDSEGAPLHAGICGVQWWVAGGLGGAGGVAPSLCALGRVASAVCAYGRWGGAVHQGDLECVQGQGCSCGDGVQGVGYPSSVCVQRQGSAGKGVRAEPRVCVHTGECCAECVCVPWEPCCAPCGSSEEEDSRACAWRGERCFVCVQEVGGIGTGNWALRSLYLSIRVLRIRTIHTVPRRGCAR